MKLSPEAKQAVKTAIEQLRLLLVDEDDAENLERLKKTFLYGAKAIIDELNEKLKTQVAMLQAEKRPHYEALVSITTNCYVSGKVKVKQA
ncbi:TPA: hypothetical protein MPK85_003102 [Salmonella enterica]|nr:hypothetical protein [Salmonella enterica]